MFRLDRLRASTHCLRGICSFAFLVFAFACALVTLAQAQSPTPLPKDVASLLSTYKLAAGDVITIRVFGEDDLSRERVRLSDAGTIPYPVLGEVRALGLTIGEIEKALQQVLTDDIWSIHAYRLPLKNTGRFTSMEWWSVLVVTPFNPG